MATPGAGNQGFNSADFRDGIHFAMEMGAAVDEADRVIFHFPKALTSEGPVDGHDIPFDPTQDVTVAEPDPVHVDCAVEYFDAAGQLTNFGVIAPSRLTITLLDQEYAQVVGCSFVVAHGDRYNYQRTEPPVGLFDVGIWVLHFQAENET